MIFLLIIISVLGVIFWTIAELISTLAAIVFVIVAAVVILRLAKDVLK